jgi:hypothetical protein
MVRFGAVLLMQSFLRGAPFSDHPMQDIKHVSE